MDGIFDIFRSVWDSIFGNKPKLLAWYGSIAHVNTRLTIGEVQNAIINTHTIIVQNVGFGTAHDVRIRHHSLDGVAYHVEGAQFTRADSTNGDGAIDFIIPALVAGRAIIVTYMYFVGRTFADIHSSVECDEGSATAKYMLQAWKPSRLLLWFKFITSIIGTIILVALAGFVVDQMIVLLSALFNYIK